MAEASETRMLEGEERTPLAFYAYTDAGSRFAVRFDPQVDECGVWFGRLQLRGHARSLGRRVHVTGYGTAPLPGGTIRLGDPPAGRGTRCPQEQIVRVEEIPVPEARG